MEKSILESLTSLGYDGPLSDGDAFSMALNGGPKSVDYTKLVHILAEELRELCDLEERVNYITDPNESSTFMLELSFFLKELSCPYKSLTTGYMSSRLQTKSDRILLLDFLISELMAAKMIKINCHKEELTPDTAIDMEESPTAKDIKEILIMLKINKPPVFITSNMLFAKLEARLKEYIQKEGDQLVGKPLYMRDQALTEEEAKHLEDTFNEMVVEYRLRREAMITRLDCTLKSFEWSTRVPRLAIRKAYCGRRQRLRAEPHVGLVDVLAARSRLLERERVPSTRIRMKVHNGVKKIIIGKVSDRGGRPFEHLTPEFWQKWKSKRKVDSEGDGSQNTVSDDSGNDYNQENTQERPQSRPSVASEHKNNHQIQEDPQFVYKQEPNGSDENPTNCSENQDFSIRNQDEHSYIQDYNLTNPKQEPNGSDENPTGCTGNPTGCSKNQDFSNQNQDEHSYIKGYNLTNLKQEANVCYEKPSGCNENQDFCNINLDENGYLQGFSLKSETDLLESVKIEEEALTNLDLLTVEINIGETSNLSLKELNNSIDMSFSSSEEPNDFAHTSKCKSIAQEVLTTEPNRSFPRIYAHLRNFTEIPNLSMNNNNSRQNIYPQVVNPSAVDNNSGHMIFTKRPNPSTFDNNSDKKSCAKRPNPSSSDNESCQKMYTKRVNPSVVDNKSYQKLSANRRNPSTIGNNCDQLESESSTRRPTPSTFNNNSDQIFSAIRPNRSTNDNNSHRKKSTNDLNPLTDDTWSNWEPNNLPDSNWLFDGPKIIKQGITTYEPLVLKMIDNDNEYIFVRGASAARLFRYLEKNVDFEQALVLAIKPVAFIIDTLVNVTANNRPFQCKHEDLYQMYQKTGDHRFQYSNPYISIHPYIALPQRRKKNQVEEMITDAPSATVKRSFSDEDSEDEPPQKIPKNEPGCNRICDVVIHNSEPMTQQQMNPIREAILDELNKIDQLTRPQYFQWTFTNNCISVRCANENSRDWLQALISRLKPWPDAQLSMKDVEVHEIVDIPIPTMNIKYIYTKGMLYFIDVTKTDEYHGVYTGTKPDADNFAKLLMYKKPPHKRPKIRSAKMKRVKKAIAREAAEAAALAAKSESSNCSGVKVKDEPQDTNYDDGNRMASTQLDMKTEQEIKAELMDVGEIETAIPNYKPPLINDGRQLFVLPPFDFYQSPQAQINAASTSNNYRVPAPTGITKRKRLPRRRKKNRELIVKEKNPNTTDASNKSVHEKYLEFLSCIE